MQIRTRLTLQFFGIVAGILSCSLLAVYSVSSRYRADAFYIRLKEKAITYSNIKLDESKKDSNLIVIINRAKKDAIYKEYVILFDSLGGEVYPNKELVPFERPPWLELIQPKKWIPQVIENGEKKFTVGEYEIYGLLYRDKECNDVYVTIAGAVDLFGRGEIRNLRNTLILVFFIVIFASAILGWLFAGRALHPILTVINEVNTISPAKLSQRLGEPENKDEIYHLINTFNNLLGRIENAFKIQKTFVANASHELKNMLTVITSQLEVSEMKERNVEEYKNTTHSIFEDIKNLNEVSNRLLELAKISGENSSVPFTPIRIDEVVWQARADVLRRNEKYRVLVDFGDFPEESNDDGLTILGNEALLKTAFLNLMENACKFSSTHDVSVKIYQKDNFTFVDFTDKGTGISEKDLPYIFEPFYRSPSTRTVKGHGIGLSLVAAIVKLHNAKIEVKSKLYNGSTFKISFQRS